MERLLLSPPFPATYFEAPGSPLSAFPFFPSPKLRRQPVPKRVTRVVSLRTTTVVSYFEEISPPTGSLRRDSPDVALPF